MSSHTVRSHAVHPSRTRRSRLLSAVLGAATLCGITLSGGAQAADQLRIGAVLYARDSQFWQQIERGMKDAAAQYKVDIQFALNRRQLPTESQVVEDLVVRRVDALVVSPLDKDASAASIGRAKKEGIPVVEYNTFLADRLIASHTIGVDNKDLAAAVGKEIRRYVDGQLGGAASIGLITLPQINPGSAVRKNGMLSALEGTKLDIVADVSGATPEEGANGVENILRRNPNTQVIWASNSGTLAGAMAAARRTGTKVKLYGVDMSREIAEEMLNPASSVEAVSDQQPYKVGFLAVEAAVKTKRGEQVPRDITVPAKIYAKADPAGVKDYIELVKSLGQ